MNSLPLDDNVLKGQKKYLKYIKKAKKDGKTHAEALDGWRKKKGLKDPAKGSKVSSTDSEGKPAKKRPKKRESGFIRPKTRKDKLTVKLSRQRVDIDVIKAHKK